MNHLAAAGQSYSLAGFLNDRLPIGSLLDGGSVLCPFDDWCRLESDLLFLAPLHKAGHMQQNAARIRGLGVPESRWAKLIDPRSAVADDIFLGPGSVIAGLTTVEAGTAIGSHSFVRPSATVGRSSAIGDFVYVGPNAVLCSHSRLEFGSHIAPGVVVRSGITVGQFAVVGLGAVVTSDVPDYAVFTGNPAQMQGEIERMPVTADSAS
jgi:acetyltransferase-like isoleucine patch superfamily enzyme